MAEIKDAKTYRKELYRRIKVLSFSTQKKFLRRADKWILEAYNKDLGTPHLHTLDYLKKLPWNKKGPLTIKEQCLFEYRLLYIGYQFNKIHEATMTKMNERRKKTLKIV